MAKSIRSKWRRKCRAIKRERYGKKEMDRLKKTLGIDNDDVKPTDISDQITESETLREQTNLISKKQVLNETTTVIDDANEMNVDSINKKFNTKTLRDKNGAYPTWLHPRKIMKKNKVKRTKQGKHMHKKNKKS